MAFNLVRRYNMMMMVLTVENHNVIELDIECFVEFVC